MIIRFISFNKKKEINLIEYINMYVGTHIRKNIFYYDDRVEIIKKSRYTPPEYT